MAADREYAAQRIQTLWRAESCDILSHFLAARPHVAASAAPCWRMLCKMASDEAANRRELAELANRLDVGLGPMTAPQRFAAGAHYLDVGALIPRLMEDKERVIAAYRRVLDAGDWDADVAAALRRILSRHEGHIASLRTSGSVAA
ncbi:MAG: hypothetical protein HZB38_17125 [Planctomycetes bacterium]|nr:hypothetical protein [Planctomycetota bacterium]